MMTRTEDFIVLGIVGVIWLVGVLLVVFVL